MSDGPPEDVAREHDLLFDDIGKSSVAGRDGLPSLGLLSQGCAARFWRLSRAGCAGRELCPWRIEELYDVVESEPLGKVEWRKYELVRLERIAAGPVQDLGRLVVAALGSKVERRVTFVVRGVWVCATVDESDDDLRQPAN